MNKLDLQNHIKETNGCTIREARKITDIFISALTDALAKGNHIQLNDFGTFYMKKIPAKQARDFRDKNVIVEVPEHNRIILKIAPKLRKLVNNR